MKALLIAWFPWWSQSDWVLKGVFLSLIIASVITWSVMVYKAWQFSTLLRRERHINRAFASGNPDPDVADTLPSRQLLAVAERWEHTQIPDRQSLESDMAQVLQEQRIRLENGLTFLATIGSSAPFIGLLGTVWGIMHALQKLGGETVLSMDMIAGPVSEALVATAVGLFAAIPAVMGYNMLVRKLRRIASVLEGNALHAINRTMQKRAPSFTGS
ncbi:MAG: MotA/TolQ/ExbB proton channel family protein [Magnetococcales bacterium]|nr:MotA/TolQ/ExbB proton channel family protein [Magnetococcales bacterium]